jgi:type VI protein secretion system component VasK
LNAWLDANADGLALLIIFGVVGIVCLLVAWAIEWRMGPRASRGEFEHLTRVSRAKRQMGQP